MGFKSNLVAASAVAIAVAGAGLVAISQADPPDKPKVPRLISMAIGRSHTRLPGSSERRS